jgi:hypothetical protein
VSTQEDIKKVLGPALEKELAPQSEIVQVCYRSRRPDQTVLEFNAWLEPIRFRLFRADAGHDTCRQSDLISKKLTTGGGLRLGMSRGEVEAVLGPPTSRQGKRLIYEASYDRPMTNQEKRRMEKQGGPPWEVKAVHVDDKIDVEFGRSGVVSIDVLHNETD